MIYFRSQGANTVLGHRPRVIGSLHKWGHKRATLCGQRSEAGLSRFPRASVVPGTDTRHNWSGLAVGVRSNADFRPMAPRTAHLLHLLRLLNLFDSFRLLRTTSDGR